MPEFAPGSVHRATVTFSNPKPAGFDYESSLCMGAWVEMATASFHLDAGQSKAVQFQVTMPTIEGTYPVGSKVTSGGVLIGTFIFAEDVVIAPAAPPSGELFRIDWWNGTSWRPITEPIPAHTYVTYVFRMRNTGNTVGAFKVGHTWYSDFSRRWEWAYSPSFNVEANTEGGIFWKLLSGPGTYTITFHLFSDDIEVDSITVTITIIPPPAECTTLLLQIAAIGEQLYYMAGVYYGYYPPNENYVRLYPVYNFPIDWYYKTYNDMTGEEQLAFEARMKQLEEEESALLATYNTYCR